MPLPKDRLVEERNLRLQWVPPKKSLTCLGKTPHFPELLAASNQPRPPQPVLWRKHHVWSWQNQGLVVLQSLCSAPCRKPCLMVTVTVMILPWSSCRSLFCLRTLCQSARFWQFQHHKRHQETKKRKRETNEEKISELHLTVLTKESQKLDLEIGNLLLERQKLELEIKKLKEQKTQFAWIQPFCVSVFKCLY